LEEGIDWSSTGEAEGGAGAAAGPNTGVLEEEGWVNGNAARKGCARSTLLIPVGRAEKAFAIESITSDTTCFGAFFIRGSQACRTCVT
jgi:hypothetical protein